MKRKKLKEELKNLLDSIRRQDAALALATRKIKKGE